MTLPIIHVLDAATAPRADGLVQAALWDRQACVLLTRGHYVGRASRYLRWPQPADRPDPVHRAALAAVARHHAGGALVAYRTEGQRLAATSQAVELVERALRGEVAVR